jgi:4-hydroxy-tetrahydrodipicolinate reductase
MMGSGDKLAVMVNGVPGRMAAATAEEVVARGLVLADEALTGPGVENTTVQIGSHSVALAAPSQHAACLQRIKDKYPRIIVVDYTHPSACNPNVELYAAAGLSFVVGTTGGDVDAMRSVVHSTPGVYAVVAPNMGKQIVAFQAMMDMMAREFPGAFDGYSMTVTESHQSTKADTSGTAKAVVTSFQQLGIDFHVNDIKRVRTPPESMEKMKVPGKYVTTGHAFHTYHLTSPDGTVNFEFQHNVCGRGVYAAGTVDAVQFLDSRRQDGREQQVFNMIDILRSGSMR